MANWPAARSFVRNRKCFFFFNVNLRPQKLYSMLPFFLFRLRALFIYVFSCFYPLAPLFVIFRNILLTGRLLKFNSFTQITYCAHFLFFLWHCLFDLVDNLCSFPLFPLSKTSRLMSLKVETTERKLVFVYDVIIERIICIRWSGDDDLLYFFKFKNSIRLLL